MMVKWDQIGIMSFLIYPSIQNNANSIANSWRLLVPGFPAYLYSSYFASLQFMHRLVWIYVLENRVTEAKTANNVHLFSWKAL
jgi:hypothetical protein